MTAPSVVISLVVYNGEAYLEQCLESLNAQTYTDYSLVIVDNNSTDNSLHVIQRFGASATLIRNKENVGFSCAHNHVIQSTYSDFVFVLNQDCVLSPDYISLCVANLMKGNRRASITGSLVRMDGLTDSSQNGIIDTLGLCIRRTFHISNIGAGQTVDIIPVVPFKVFGVSATAALYRREALFDVLHHNVHPEYFDEDFFMYKEDVDLAFRLHQKGWEAWCEPRAKGLHVRSTKSQLFVRKNPKINSLSYQNHLLFLMKNITWPLALRYGFFILLYEVMKFFFLAFREPSTLRALSHAWKLREAMQRKRPPCDHYRYPIFFGCNIPPHAN